MTNHNCGECLYNGICASHEECKHFAPLHEDMLLDEYIEQDRDSFYDEWFQYIGEYAG